MVIREKLFANFIRNGVIIETNFIIDSFTIYKERGICPCQRYGCQWRGNSRVKPAICANQCLHSRFFIRHRTEGHCACLTKSEADGSCVSNPDNNYDTWCMIR